MTTFVPVAWPPPGPGTGGAETLNVPLAPEDVSDVTVSVPLPSCPPAAQLPITVVPVVVRDVH